MKKLCGATAKEIREGYIFGVETDDYMGKNWSMGTFAECQEMAKRYSEMGIFSDFDSMTTYYQPEHLKPLAEFWFNTTMKEGHMSMKQLFDKYAEEAN